MYISLLVGMVNNASETFILPGKIMYTVRLMMSFLI